MRGRRCNTHQADAVCTIRVLSHRSLTPQALESALLTDVGTRQWVRFESEQLRLQVCEGIDRVDVGRSIWTSGDRAWTSRS